MDKIQKRFDELEVMAEQIEQSKREETHTVPRDPAWIPSHRDLPPETFVTQLINDGLVIQWQTSVLSLLQRTLREDSATYKQFASILAERLSVRDKFGKLKAVFMSAKSDYEGGYLFDMRNLVHAEVFSNELEQADHFLEAGYKTPAAVIAGVVLETTLRKLCEQTDNIEPSDSMNRMNDDLTKSSVYNKMRADQVRAWAKIRNDAAHGNPDQFDEGDVRRMIEGVRDFVANQMG